MAAHDALPPEHHIVRVVGANRYVVLEDGQIAFAFSALQRKPDEEGLSVNWLEHELVDGSLVETLRYILMNRSVGNRSRLAVLNVAQTQAVAREYNHKVRIIHLPDGANEPHSEIRQLPIDDIALLETLAQHHIVNSEECGLLKAQL